MSFRRFYVEFPNSIKSNEYKFKINNDDLSSVNANKLAKFLRGEGYEVKRSRYDSPTKLMSWYNFTLKKEGIHNYKFEHNIDAVNSLVDRFAETLKS